MSVESMYHPHQSWVQLMLLQSVYAVGSFSLMWPYLGIRGIQAFQFLFCFEEL